MTEAGRLHGRHLTRYYLFGYVPTDKLFSAANRFPEPDIDLARGMRSETRCLQNGGTIRKDW